MEEGREERREGERGREREGKGKEREGEGRRRERKEKGVVSKTIETNIERLMVINMQHRQRLNTIAITNNSLVKSGECGGLHNSDLIIN